jgi:hypothetical protein
MAAVAGFLGCIGAAADPIPSLINMDLGISNSTKTGPAVIGQGTNDFWNVGWYSPIANLSYANGSVSLATISIINGMFGGYCGSSDPMYDSYVFNNYYASDVTVVATGLIPGLYDFYAYSPDASFTLTVGTNNLGTRACYDSPFSNPPVWQEGLQYVRYTNVLVGAGDTVTLRAGGVGKISGLQIAGIDPALAMVEQPQSRTNNAGDNVVLTGSAVGTPAVYYQWLFEGTNLPGATAASLALTNVQFSQQGNYSLLASNSAGVITSSNAFLTVQAPPDIHRQPVSLVLGAGSDAFFFAFADGSPPLSLQWLHNGSPVPGATGDSLTVSNVQAASIGDYTLAITNLFGGRVSDAANLSVTGTAPSIVWSPTNLTATRGAPVEFWVSARGTEPLSYQWTKDSLELPGQTQQTLSFEAVQPGDAGTYQAIITNINGSGLTAPATLSVTPPPGFLWAQQLGGTDIDEAKCVAADADGNVHVAGYFRGTAVFGATTLVSTGGPDIFLAKCDRLGHPLWVRQAGSTSVYQSGNYSSDVALGLATDPDGNAYITGSFTGNASFGGFHLAKASGAALFLAKYSPSGDALWAVQSAGSGNAQGNGLCVGPNGSVLVAGVFMGTNTLSTNSLSLTNQGSSNLVFVACFDANGRAAWAKKGTGGARSQGRAIAAGFDGTIYVTGDFSGTVNFDGIEVVENAASETGDLYVAAYEPGGNVVWVATGGGAYADSGAGVACDAGGNVFVTGSFKRQARFGEVTLSAGALPEIFLAKYDQYGKPVWARSAGGGSPDYGNAIAVDSGGNACLAGSFSVLANFSGTNVSAYGADDAFVAMYTADGNHLWVRNAGGGGADSVAGICVDAAGNLCLAGTFTGPAILGNVTLPGAGNKDAWVSRLAPVDPDLPPAITLQPQDQTLPAGSCAGLSVGFIGGPPLAFQWRLDGMDLPGQTNAALTFSTVLPADGGGYSLVISNSFGAVTSAVATVTVAVEPDYLWSRRAGGASNDEATAVAIDAAGNLYAAGYFSGTADFSGTALVSHGGEDIFVAKYNDAGTLQWVAQAGGTGDDRAAGLALDSTGNRVLVTGFFTGGVNFGVTNLTSAGNTDILLAQLDRFGNWVWASQGGGPLRDAALGVAVDDSGNAYITGYCQGSARFDNYTLSAGTTNEVFVARYNSLGRVAWAVRAGGTSSDTGRAIACDRKGHVYVAGSFYGSAAFGAIGLNSTGDLGTFLAQYSTVNGLVLWARQAGSTGQSDDEALALCADREGSALVSGYFRNQAFFGSHIVSAATSTAPDLFLAKYDVDGNVLWLQQAGGILSDYGNSLATDACGNAYLAGAFSGTARFGANHLACLGSSDFFVALYDAAGRLVKVRQGGGLGADAAQAIAADGKGGAVATGYYGADAFIGSNALAGFGGRDVFVSRLQLFASNAAPFLTTSPATQTALFGSNAVFMAGASSGTSATFRWLFNGVGIANATNSFLGVTNVQYANMGSYRVVVSNAFGVVTSAVAQLTVDVSPEFVWLHNAGGPQDDAAQAIATDSQGNIFVAGYVKTNAWFGAQAVTNAWLEDVFLAKYSSDGGLLWVNTAGGTSGDFALALAVDPGDNPIVAGTFSSARATFGPWTLTNAGSQDIFIAKYDTLGAPLWAKQAGYSYADQAGAVAVDLTGNIYLTGFGGFITKLDGLWLTNNPGTNFLIAKYDPAGNALWAKTAIGTNICFGTGITVDRGTNILVTGTLLGRVDFGTGPILNTNSTTYGGTVFLANYAPNGSLRWSAKGIGETAGYAQSIKTDAAGNIFATAYMRSYGDSPTITKYDSVGRRLWTHFSSLSCCTGDYLSADGLALDADGNPYVCGAATWSSYLDSYPVNRQGYVAKFRGSDGALFWVQRAGRAANGVAVDAANNTYLAGRFTSPGYFGPTNILAGTGLNDAFVARISVVGPGISADPASRTVVTGSNAVLSVTATGTGPLSYQWLFNGAAINGATNASLTLNGFLPGNAGLYSVIVRNTAGSVTSAPATLTLIPVLQAARAGDVVVLSWLGTFTLQGATNAPGPYFDLPAGGSPYTNDLAEPQRFFRLRSP